MTHGELTLDAYADDVSADEPLKRNDGAEGPFHSHGYVLRVRLCLERDLALAALGHIEWGEDSADWLFARLKRCRRWTMRGSTFITHAKPRNKRLPMAQFNADWKTNLYSLIVDDDGAGVALTFHGVRRRDVETVLRNKMGLGDADYHIEYYTALERYFVLPAHEAHRLAAALGGVATSGRGRAARKRYLLQDLNVPIVVGKRARRTAKLTIYRLTAGATAQYKVELRLKGRSRDRAKFTEDDIVRLDAELEHLIREYRVRPIAKPARWEPATVDEWRRDTRLAAIGQSAYRGRAVDEDRARLAWECHTPCLRFLTKSSDGSLPSVSPQYIRMSEPLGAPPDGASSRRPRCHPAWRAVARDVSSYAGYLTEVILDADQDPAPVVEALIAPCVEGVAVGALAYVDSDGRADTWGSLSRLVTTLSAFDDAQLMVVVVDFSVVLAVESAMFQPVGESLSSWTPGPLYPSYWQQAWGLPPWEKAVGSLMAPLFREQRERAESDGIRIVLITTDLRPAHGRGELLRTHKYRDGRVRSHVGDAGRHYAHLRYLVDSDANGMPTKITMAKDEGEGLPGRIIWG